MTNNEKINAMSIEEKAIFLAKQTQYCTCCQIKYGYCMKGRACKDNFAAWLESEVEE